MTFVWILGTSDRHELQNIFPAFSNLNTFSYLELTNCNAKSGPAHQKRNMKRHQILNFKKMKQKRKHRHISIFNILVWFDLKEVLFAHIFPRSPPQGQSSSSRSSPRPRCILMFDSQFHLDFPQPRVQDKPEPEEYEDEEEKEAPKVTLTSPLIFV